MRAQFTAFIDTSITFLLYLVAGVTPLLFLSLTTEFYEMPKLAFLVITTTILMLLWFFGWILRGKIVLTRTPLDFPLLALLVIILLSTFLGDSRIISIYGNFPAVHGSAASWVTYILLYFIAVSNLKTSTVIKNLLTVLYVSGVALAVISLLSYFSVFLPFDFTRAVNFTPTGSSFSTVAYLLLLLPLPLLSIVHPKKYMPVSLALSIATVFSATIVLIGSLSGYIALIITFILSLIAARPSDLKKSLSLFLIPLVAIAAILTLSYAPIAGTGGLRELASNFPREIQLPFPISWKISASAFRDAPFIGTGPATNLFNFTSYKPAEFNLLPYWNFSFEAAYNEFLQALSTIGLLGLLSLLVISGVVLKSGWKILSKHTHDAAHGQIDPVTPAMAISGIVAVVLMAVHATTLVSLIVTLLVFALFMVSQTHIREKTTEMTMGIKASTQGDKQLDLFPIITFIILLIIAIPTLIKTVSVVNADRYHRLALTQGAENGTKIYENLQRAEQTNPQIDLYRVDLAQTNFALANAIAQNAPKNDEGQLELSAEDTQRIQALLSQSVNEGRVAVALSPRSARNWEVLASVYRNISGVAENALAFALDAYGQAIQRDPLNPALRVSVGGIYYAIGNYDLAIRFFSDAANLKPDYANAYYNLAIALREKGDIQNATVVAEQTVALLQENKESQDYKTASALLEELRQEAGSEQEPETGQDETALDAAGVEVDVEDLDNPPDVATPSAVESNPDARIPNLSPTPAQNFQGF